MRVRVLTSGWTWPSSTHGSLVITDAEIFTARLRTSGLAAVGHAARADPAGIPARARPPPPRNPEAEPPARPNPGLLVSGLAGEPRGPGFPHLLGAVAEPMSASPALMAMMTVRTAE